MFRVDIYYQHYQHYQRKLGRAVISVPGFGSVVIVVDDIVGQLSTTII